MSADFANINAAGFTDEGTYTPDRLHDRETLAQKIVIKSGAGVLARASLLGKITKGAATTAVKASGANTGTGTISAVTLLSGAKNGVYPVRFTSATAWTLADPDGFELGVGANGTANADDLGFTTTAGGTAFVAGDGFDITVAAGSGKYVLSLAAATDGSEVPRVVLAEPVDATAADAEAISYVKGRFNQAALILGAGHTLASIADGLADRNIYIEPVIG